MESKSYKSEAIVLYKRNYSEADRIITVFTKSFGKMTLIAKGVRKTKSKKRGSLEIFNKIYFSASRSHGMDIITEVDLQNSYEEIRRNISKMSVGYFFVEVLSKLTRDDEKNEKLYQILVGYLSELQQSRTLKVLRNTFTHEVLVNLGFWPAGKTIGDPDKFLEMIIERKLSSRRVGKKMLQA